MSTENSTGPAKKPKAKKTIPAQDLEVGKVSDTASKKWEADPEITLKWKKVADFKTDVANYNAQLKSRTEAGETRPEITARLKELDKAIDKGLKFVKGYLQEDFDKQSSAQFAKYGIEKKGDKYSLPRDRNKRVPALDTLLKGIQAGGYNNKKYGKAYFTPLITEYKTLYASAGDSDSNVSSLVSDKNVLRKEIVKVLTALINVLKGNYPDTYKSVLRTWGFHKEKY